MKKNLPEEITNIMLSKNVYEVDYTAGFKLYKELNNELEGNVPLEEGRV